MDFRHGENVTRAQLRAIHVAARAAGIDDELRKDMMAERFGVRSAALLTGMQASALLDELNRKSGHKGKPRPWQPRARRAPAPENMIRMASKDQHEKIAVLAALIKWRVADGLSLFLQKRMGVSRVRTEKDGYLAIEGLKKLFIHQMDAELGKDWWDMDWSERPEIALFIDEHARKKDWLAASKARRERKYGK